MAALIPTGLQVTEAGTTLVRTRGEFLCGLSDNALMVAEDRVIGAVGIGIMQLRAFNAGAASVPRPYTEDYWDGWLWHSYIQLVANSATQSTALQAPPASQRLTIDSKAQRKLEVDDVIFGIIEIVETGTTTSFYSMETRLLAKLS